MFISGFMSSLSRNHFSVFTEVTVVFQFAVLYSDLDKFKVSVSVFFSGLI